MELCPRTLIMLIGPLNRYSGANWYSGRHVPVPSGADLWLARSALLFGSPVHMAWRNSSITLRIIMKFVCVSYCYGTHLAKSFLRNARNTCSAFQRPGSTYASVRAPNFALFAGVPQAPAKRIRQRQGADFCSLFDAGRIALLRQRLGANAAPWRTFYKGVGNRFLPMVLGIAAMSGA